MFSRMLKKNSAVWEFLFNNFGHIMQVEKNYISAQKLGNLKNPEA